MEREGGIRGRRWRNLLTVKRPFFYDFPKFSTNLLSAVGGVADGKVGTRVGQARVQEMLSYFKELN